MGLRNNLLSIVLAGICLTIAISPAVGPGTAAATPNPAANVDDCADHERSYADREPTPDETIIELEQTAATDTARLVVVNASETIEFRYSFRAEFTDANGFDISPSGRTATLATTDGISWVNVSVPSDEGKFSSPEASMNTLIELPETTEPVYYTPASEGYVHHQYAILGSYSHLNQTVGCQNLNLIIPASANDSLETRPQQMMRMLAAASEEIAIGRRYPTITAHVAPAPFGPRVGFVPRAESYRGGGSEMVISPNVSERMPNNVLVHEYVHTTQRNPNPKWVSEGEASFLATEVAVQKGWVTPRRADAFWLAKRSSTTGAESSAMGSNPYVRGYYFFANLDRQLGTQGYELEPVIEYVESERRTGGEAGRVDTWQQAVAAETDASANITNPYQKMPPATYFLQEPELPPRIRFWLGELSRPLWRAVAAILAIGLLWMSKEGGEQSNES